MDGQTCPSILFRRTFACKNFFTNFFSTCSRFWVTLVKSTCQTWIHAGHREVEGARRRVRVGVGASTRAHPCAQWMAASRTH